MSSDMQGCPPFCRSREDLPDGAEEARVLGHHLIELAEVQPHPLTARALVQLDAPKRDGDQLSGTPRTPPPGNGEDALSFFFGPLSFPLLSGPSSVARTRLSRSTLLPFVSASPASPSSLLPEDSPARSRSSSPRSNAMSWETAPGGITPESPPGPGRSGQPPRVPATVRCWPGAVSPNRALWSQQLGDPRALAERAAGFRCRDPTRAPHGRQVGAQSP